MIVQDSVSIELLFEKMKFADAIPKIFGRQKIDCANELLSALSREIVQSIKPSRKYTVVTDNDR